MLEPIATWTRRSLQFQPPLTQPLGVSCQPLPIRTTNTDEAAATAMIQAGASARRAATMPAPVGRGIGVSQRWRICATTTEANARMTALTMTDSGPKPVTRATTFTRCDET